MFWGKKQPNIVTDKEAVDLVLTRGVSEIFPSKEGLMGLLMSGKRITLYQGFDPTGTKLHIGHMVGLRKLSQFQQLGHRVIFLIGDGTGQAGDPSGKSKARDTFYNTKELRENARDYVMQAGKIVSFSGKNKAEVMFNSAWLNTMNLTDILDVASNFSLQQLSERDIFKTRIARGETVNLREFLYPLLQGYDSVAMKVDLEIGATDQTFNMLVGRTLVKRYLDKEKFVLTTPLLTDTSGKKIGKTEGNAIGLTDDPNDLYGKILALGDEVIVSGLEYLTNIPMEEVKDIGKKLEKENPKKYKELLAKEVVKQLHGEEKAENAERAFKETFGRGGVPKGVGVLKQKNTVMQTLVDARVVSSNTEWRRLIEEGAVKNMETGKVVEDPMHVSGVPETFKIGKKRFVKIKP